MLRRLTACALLVGLALPASGCIGLFAVTKAVLNFNLAVTKDRFARNVV